MQSRRTFIQSLGAAGLLLPLSPLLAKSTAGVPFNPFVVPALDRGIRQGNKVTFNLTINAAQTSFFKDVKTPTLGLNQSYLGPVLRARRGDTVRINVKNSINEVSTVHWHGMTLPAKMDGGPINKNTPN